MKKSLAYRLGMLLLALGLLLIPGLWARGQGEETAVVISPEAILYAEPSLQAETVSTLPEGTVLTTFGLDESREWVGVQTSDGEEGWVSLFDVHIFGPYLPPEDGLTRTVIDGSSADWSHFTGPFVDASGDSSGAADIQAVRSFMNETYLYVLVEVTGNSRDVDLLLIDLVTNTDGEYRTYQYAQPRHRVGTLFVVTEEEGQARNAVGVLEERDTAIELRLPLELIDSPDSLNLVAVRVQEAAGGITDELVQVMPAVVTLEAEPVTNGAMVENVRVNLRAEPVTGAVIRVLAGEPVSILARTEDESWLLIRLTDTSVGWVAAEFVLPEVDVQSLPVEG